MKTAVAQGLNNKLQRYQQKYNTTCEAGTTLVLFKVQSHLDILYGNKCLDTCKFCEAYCHKQIHHFHFNGNKDSGCKRGRK